MEADSNDSTEGCREIIESCELFEVTMGRAVGGGFGLLSCPLPAILAAAKSAKSSECGSPSGWGSIFEAIDDSDEFVDRLDRVDFPDDAEERRWRRTDGEPEPEPMVMWTMLGEVEVVVVVDLCKTAGAEPPMNAELVGGGAYEPAAGFSKELLDGVDAGCCFWENTPASRVSNKGTVCPLTADEALLLDTTLLLLLLLVMCSFPRRCVTSS